MIEEHLWVALQRHAVPVDTVHYFETIPSTNQEAMAWLTDEAPDGTLLVANQQTAGRGRLGRQWFTPPGVALAFSIILHPSPLEVENSALFSPLGALAVSQALIDHYHLPAQIKWPNDVLINGRKVCGILAEMAWLGDMPVGVVLGIGVNVSAGAVPPPSETLFPAACVEDFTGQTVERWDLLAYILNALVDWRPRLASPEFMQTWQERLAFYGEWVDIRNTGDDSHLHGRVNGVAANGSLRILDAQDNEHLVEVGDVHLRPATPLNW